MTDKLPNITTNNLSIGYRSRKKQLIIAKNINFKLFKGELVGIVGANGIGKSTLIKTLGRIIDPISGEVIYQSREINSFRPKELAKTVSLVFSRTPDSLNYTAEELVALGRVPYANWIGHIRKKDRELVAFALEQTGTLALRGKKCFELSDGQLQKIMIARALAQDTPLVMIDEPTTHLDIEHQFSILALLFRIAKKQKKTVLFSSHDIERCVQVCDKIIVMLNGKIAVETPEVLIKNGWLDKFSSSRVFDKNLGLFSKVRKP